ncbi:MAG: hypothetical protein QNL93_11875 [Opitutae bacterium]|jgi:hypothetical protein
MEQTDLIISFQEAANILGYKHINSIIRFINDGHLQVHYTHESLKKALKLSDVLNLASPDK